MTQVLLIEPNKPLAATIEKFLQEDFQVVVCHTAQSAIIAADADRPAIVILELAMPKNNGVAFLHEFRSYTDWLTIPVIIYSHIPIEDTGLNLTEWQKQHVVAYMYKPTASLANLHSAVEQHETT